MSNAVTHLEVYAEDRLFFVKGHLGSKMTVNVDTIRVPADDGDRRDDGVRSRESQ